MHPAWKPPNRAAAALGASTLASLVERTLAQAPLYVRPETAITLVNPLPEVTWAYVNRTRQEYGGHWAASFGSDVHRASEADIRATVARKDPDVVAYRKAAP